MILAILFGIMVLDVERDELDVNISSVNGGTSWLEALEQIGSKISSLSVIPTLRSLIEGGLE